MTMRTRRPGEFCWINILTPKPAESREFFANVLGWEFFEMPGMGHGIKVGGRNIGGLFDTVSERTPNGTVPMIGVMVKVESADATAEKIRALGGTADAAFDVGPAGRMAVCHDPNGAQFDLWQPKAMHGTDVDSRLHGAPYWFETRTTDVPRAMAFYTELFGWTAELRMTTGAPYTLFKLGGEPVAGVLPSSSEEEGVKPAWGVNFAVDDIDVAMRSAIALGANAIMPVMDVPGVGRFGGLRSPYGVTFFVAQLAA